MFAGLLPAFLAYLTYLGSGLALLALFAWLYCKITPLDELKLIRDHGHAAAVSFAGALLGFSLTLASSAWHLNDWQSFMTWALLAMLVQILVHLVVARCLKDLTRALIDNNLAMGILAGSIHLAVGLVNAGSLS
ncbi:hypothetical protein DK842_07870 [Chromobacterium phragmitis]|uniref:DUF350 domain-containing protein n=1 Tax=Chromobacterium phragmitis TaxID=2202141 RepID=A0A344UIV7_9NEIS|nr:DUF350 domain-containing protein [Chromobacterium phragmitis]AXE29812.1 hypothetical protein DK842_07870 [Chromobacterium phragmitis]AXE35205.1 hypothetical protein DK843_13435 [Chromobacterium phragmitis]